MPPLPAGLVGLSSGRSAAIARVISIFAVMWLPGCAGFRPTETGFLASYKGMAPDPPHLSWALGLQRAETREATARDLAAIDSYTIEPVAWRVDPETRGGRSPERADRLCAALERELREQLGRSKPVVDRPGPHTARVRSAITVVHLSRPVCNVLLTATLISPYGPGPLFVGGGTVEAEVIAPDGRQLAAVSSASGGGWFDVVGYYTLTDHALKAMHRCAGELVEAIAPTAASSHPDALPPETVEFPWGRSAILPGPAAANLSESS